MKQQAWYYDSWSVPLLGALCSQTLWIPALFSANINWYSQRTSTALSFSSAVLQPWRAQRTSFGVSCTQLWVFSSYSELMWTSTVIICESQSDLARSWSHSVGSDGIFSESNWFQLIIYGIGAGLAFWGAYKSSIPPVLPAAYAAICLGFAGQVMLQLVDKPYYQPGVWEFLETEEGREISGLLVIAFEMILLASGSFGRARLFLGLCSGLGALYCLYALFFLQPMMNARLQVEHCKGSFAWACS